MLHCLQTSKNMNEFSYKHKLTDKITFGKHKGETVRSVIINDLGYLTWLYYKCTNIMFDLAPETFYAMEYMIAKKGYC